jgi:hypothetical protein
MKHLLTAIACFFALSMSAQTWNPDADFDNVIGVNDLMALLSVFGSEWTAEYSQDPEYDLAAYYVGEKKFIDCLGECASNNGRITSVFEYAIFQDEIEQATGISWATIGDLCENCSSGSCGLNPNEGTYVRDAYGHYGEIRLWGSAQCSYNSLGSYSLQYQPYAQIGFERHCVCSGLIPAVD